MAVVRPENTAIPRKGASRPLRDAVGAGWVRESDVMLDFGCGRGADVVWLTERGHDVEGYDVHVPFGRHQRPTRTFDVVLVIYVVNVLGSVSDRVAALSDAWTFVRPGGAMVVVSRDVRTIETEAERGSWKPVFDGYWSNEARGMFQHGHTVEDLAGLVSGLPPIEIVRSPRASYSGILARKAGEGPA